MKNELAEVADREYKNQMVSISNSVIRSREYTNLLESKIEVLAVYYMDTKAKQRKRKDIQGNQYVASYVELSASDIKKLMGRSDGKSYQEIKDASENLLNKKYIIEDRERHVFEMKNMYSGVKYDRGALEIEFAPGMEQYFLNLKNNFTRLSLPILFSFKKNGGFQLYKLLKSYAYQPNLPPVDMSYDQESMPTFEITWNLSDLRMLMGYVDINQDALRREGSKKHPDWEKMVRDEKKPQYKRWADFRKRVLIPGIEEINQMSDIYIKDIDKGLTGQGGKVTAVTFSIQHNRAYYEKAGGAAPKVEPESAVVLNEGQIDDFIDEMREFLDVLKTRDLKAIAEASGYNMELIRKEYAISKNFNIDNLTAWMIAAVREGYEEPVKTSKKPKKNFENERDYDYDELEKTLVNRHNRRVRAV